MSKTNVQIAKPAPVNQNKSNAKNINSFSLQNDTLPVDKIQPSRQTIIQPKLQPVHKVGNDNLMDEYLNSINIFQCDNASLVSVLNYLMNLKKLKGNHLALLSNLKIDADGALNVYAPLGIHDARGNGPLDYRENAGHDIGDINSKTKKPYTSREWWGVVTDNGKKEGNPVQQTNGVYKDFYISPTSFSDPFIKDKKNPQKYVDSNQIAYLVLTPELKKNKVSLGNLGYAINTDNKMVSAFILGDSKKKNSTEGSIKLAQNLGLDSNPRSKHAGTDNKIIKYFIFPNSNFDFIHSQDEVERKAKEHLFYFAWANSYKT